MARAGTIIDETIPVAGMGAGAALDGLLAAVSATGDYQAVSVAPDRLQFARTYRPTWAVVCGWSTIWLALVGVLFFFVKTTETCLAVVESDHRGTRIKLTGRLSSAAIGRVRAALTGESSVVVAPALSFGAPIGEPTDVVFQPQSPVDFPPPHSLSPHPAAHPPPLPAEVPPPGPSQPVGADSQTVVVPSRRSTGPAIVLPDGRRVDLSDRALLGRDPAATETDDDAVQLIALLDETRSVSKTHAELALRDGSWWVLDCHSTNGVELDDGTGVGRRLEPGVAVRIDPDTTIRLGDQCITLTAGR